MASMIKDKVFPDCPIRNILARICDKWSMLIIYTLNAHADEPLRFNALRKLIPDISQKMLTSTLRTLEEDGFVRRVVYAEVPPRVEYSLTDRSFTLIPIIEELIGWAANNMAPIMKDRERSAKCLVQ
ncbi:MAG: helix-turn-helix domain-containing protein [Prevotellamassilia sp.]|jgi:DNA-binding HxlR family transcriptional regulator|nr:helix-turn-helix domain-containing protein [Prevotellamassilia sp.]